MSDPYEQVRDRCAIVGVGSTEYSKASGRSVMTLAMEASLAALADSGLAVADIDGIVRCNMDEVRHNDLALGLGIDNLTYWSEVGPGGAAPCAMVGQAAAAILSGQASSVLVYRSLNGRSGRRFGTPDPRAAAVDVGGKSTYDEFFFPYGLMMPGHMFSMIAQRHMHEFGTTSEQLGSIAVTCRNRANANPAAMMYDRPLSMDDYLAGRMISSPLRVFDYSLETDGACAVVVTSAERAKDCRQRPALIRAVAQGTGRGVSTGEVLPLLINGQPITTFSSAATAEVLYQRAGLGPADIDVAQLYDCFTITVLVQLEDYGFCAKGEGGPFAQSGAIQMDGAVPINTAGGNLSEAYMQGMSHIIEGVRQVRGQSTSQVEGAEICLVTSSPPPTGSALILAAA